jgi:hypothetical protein
MSLLPRQVAVHPGLFDQNTGQWIGVVNILGEEQPVLTPNQIANLTAPGALSGVTYDTGSRATAWTIDGVTYTASYSSSLITVAGSDGKVTSISLDPANRITGVTTA